MIIVKYVKGEQPEKVLELKCPEQELVALCFTEYFILQEVMHHEEPNLISILPLAGDSPRGQHRPPSTPRNIDLMNRHEIKSLTYEISGQTFQIST